jgi:hypothetical protein
LSNKRTKKNTQEKTDSRYHKNKAIKRKIFL